jgi:NAD(P)-dependent dehydrogenase (short-subunit alcohol dehydrogenase family)
MSLNPPIRNLQGQSAWLVGASTGIGAALAAALHARGARVAVSARRSDKLREFTQAHAGSLAVPVDVLDAAALRSAARQVVAQLGPLDFVLYCAGHYVPQRADEAFDLAACMQQWQTNYQGALHLLDALLPQLLAQGHGHLSLVASVAGYRGLPQALGYGPAKAALANLAETLYFDLHPRGLGVSVVNPGFVETPMTAINRFRMPALQTPQQAAQAMLDGYARGEFEIHFPKRFTRVLKLMRLLPPAAYFALARKGMGL